MVPLRIDVGGIRHPEGQHLRALLAEKVGDIEAERRIAAGMGTGFLSVDPDLRGPVDRFEMEEDPLLLPVLRDGERRLIPKGLFLAHHLSDSRKGGLDRERDEDLSVADDGLGRLFPGHGIVPEAVQRLPAGTDHLGTGIFGMGILRRNFRRPAGLDPVPCGGIFLGGSAGDGKGKSGENRQNQIFSHRVWNYMINVRKYI